MNRLKSYLYLGLGWTCLGLGAAGVVLPLLPTTPFLLLAAFGFARGSQRWHGWLVNHPVLGTPIRNWQLYRAISVRAKWSGTIALGLLLALSVWLRVGVWVLVLQVAVVLAVATFLWSRPSLSQVDR